MFIKVLAHYILLQHNIRRATIYNTWLLTRFCYYRSVWYCRIVSQLNSFHDGNMGSYPTTISNYHRFRIINHSIGIILIAKRMSVAINDSYIPADVQLSPKVILSPQDMSKQEFGMNPFPISTHPFTFKTEPHGMSNISFIFNIDLLPQIAI